MEKQSAIPTGVKVLASILFLFGLLAFFGSLFMWGEGFLLSFPPGVDYRFPITDMLVNAPACILTAVGLWLSRRYGYIAAQFTAGFFRLCLRRNFRDGLPGTASLSHGNHRPANLGDDRGLFPGILSLAHPKAVQLSFYPKNML